MGYWDEHYGDEDIPDIPGITDGSNSPLEVPRGVSHLEMREGLGLM